MTAPLFQAATRGEAYQAPDYQAIEREQDAIDTGTAPRPRVERYEPAPVSQDEEDRIKEDMRLNRIPVDPDTYRHALEAEEIRKLLRRYHVRSLRKVGATRDFQGVVKLNFADFRALVNALLEQGATD
jgi:hypothetical protein